MESKAMALAKMTHILKTLDDKFETEDISDCLNETTFICLKELCCEEYRFLVAAKNAESESLFSRFNPGSDLIVLSMRKFVMLSSEQSDDKLKRILVKFTDTGDSNDCERCHSADSARAIKKMALCDNCQRRICVRCIEELAKSSNVKVFDTDVEPGMPQERQVPCECGHFMKIRVRFV